jgi:hypothetical protein
MVKEHRINTVHRGFVKLLSETDGTVLIKGVKTFCWKFFYIIQNIGKSPFTCNSK